MADLPLVSVVTPSYNQGMYIERTIRSVLNQDYPNIEHIIIDGGSVDGTLDVLRSYKHLKWVSEKDSGTAEAINKGWRCAQGEILCCLPSDDTLAPDAIGRVVRTFSERPEAQVVYGDCNVIDENDRITGTVRSRKFNLYRLFLFNYILEPTVFLRRRVLEMVGLLDETLQYACDYDLWLRIGKQEGRMIYIGEVLASFRVHPGSKSVAQKEGAAEELRKVLIKNVQNAGSPVRAVMFRMGRRGNLAIQGHLIPAIMDCEVGRLGRAIGGGMAAVVEYPPLIAEKSLLWLMTGAVVRLMIGHSRAALLKRVLGL